MQFARKLHQQFARYENPVKKETVYLFLNALMKIKAVLWYARKSTLTIDEQFKVNSTAAKTERMDNSRGASDDNLDTLVCHFYLSARIFADNICR